jgi:NitT/TauT family transport system permease protein
METTPTTTLRYALRSLRRQFSFLMVFSIALMILAWQVVTSFDNVKPYLLPSPAAVVDRFAKSLADGSLLTNASYTLVEVLAGLALGVIIASTAGYVLAKSRTLERLLAPLIIASQSVPVVAIAPLLLIWFGSGLLSKVLICTLIVFFPVLINTIVGLRTVPENLRDLMRSLHATRWQTFMYLELPAALPVLLGGVRIGAAMSVVGAVVGEFLGAKHGLGFMINQGRGIYDTALVFVAVISLVVMALSLYGIVLLIETRMLSWQARSEESNQLIQ